QKDSIIYRTGDLGKWTEDGEINYIGRVDFQIKINGQRIELSEIENVISEIDSIFHVVVIDKLNSNNEKYLICYYISESDLSGNEIRTYLKNKLPGYMIPNYYKKINKIPLTPSGKLNRKLLPEPSLNDKIKDIYEAPKTNIEKTLCKIYSEIFNIDKNKIGITDNFFDLGGTSLIAIRMISKIHREFNINLKMKEIM
ncbi:hypothetical protein PIROE2DRAFT_36510, partial [Piromyces sp. E2]